jgi:biopolymer transport protein ExbB/TolQ
LAALFFLNPVFGTAIGAMRAVGAIGSEWVDPTRKARILAEGISEAMNCTALGLLLLVVVAVPVLLVTRKDRRSNLAG